MFIIGYISDMKHNVPSTGHMQVVLDSLMEIVTVFGCCTLAGRVVNVAQQNLRFPEFIINNWNLDTENFMECISTSSHSPHQLKKFILISSFCSVNYYKL